MHEEERKYKKDTARPEHVLSNFHSLNVSDCMIFEENPVSEYISDLYSIRDPNEGLSEGSTISKKYLFHFFSNLPTK